MKTVKPEYLETLEFMLDDYGIELVLCALADTLDRRAAMVEPKHRMHGQDQIYRLQAEALRAQGQALTAGRALTYATQAPLETALRGSEREVSHALDVLSVSERTLLDCERFAKCVAHIFRRHGIFNEQVKQAETAMSAIRGKRFR